MAERQTNSKPEKQDCETRQTIRKIANVTGERRNRKSKRERERERERKRETYTHRERKKTVRQIES